MSDNGLLAASLCTEVQKIGEEGRDAVAIRWIIEGQFKRPLRVIAFNTEEGWSRHVTRKIAEKLLDLNNAGTALGARRENLLSV